jgi:CPA2 family monovalent cation:H+ antiporter-2
VPTVSGDGADPEILRRAGIGYAHVVFVTIPRDELSIDVVKTVRGLNPTAEIAARTRYRANIPILKRAGAALVLCEENSIAEDMLQIVMEHLDPQPSPAVS